MIQDGLRRGVGRVEKRGDELEVSLGMDCKDNSSV